MAQVSIVLKTGHQIPVITVADPSSGFLLNNPHVQSMRSLMNIKKKEAGMPRMSCIHCMSTCPLLCSSFNAPLVKLPLASALYRGSDICELWAELAADIPLSNQIYVFKHHSVLYFFVLLYFVICAVLWRCDVLIHA